ncbi:MAG: DUF4192 family protein [Actinomycetaceae bacterium]|nr:DUF4192 family protein [Arcanobacterium sp.]MDD7504698.1 DUF4192 family protein [Actinomycetaceae bacterium]MDY6142968.1 DUF4192 family protein [Arcanobacterium sp.]
MTTTLTLADPSELIPVIPRILHRNINGDIVGIGLRRIRGGHGGSGAHYEILPAFVSPCETDSTAHGREVEAVAQGVAVYVAEYRPHELCIFVYLGHDGSLQSASPACGTELSCDPLPPCDAPPLCVSHAYKVLEAVRRCARDDSLSDTEGTSRHLTTRAYIVRGNSWAAIARDTPRGANMPPPVQWRSIQWRSVDELNGSEIAASTVWEGHAVAPTLREQYESIVVDASHVVRVFECVTHNVRAGWKPNIAGWNRVLRNMETTDSRRIYEVLGPERIAKMYIALRNTSVRDKLLVYALSPQIETLAGITSQQVIYLLDQATTHRPDTCRVARVIKVLLSVAPYSPAGDASIFAVIGYLCWWTGSSAMADYFTRKALARDPNYSLANLVERAVHVQLPPPWYEEEQL